MKNASQKTRLKQHPKEPRDKKEPEIKWRGPPADWVPPTAYKAQCTGHSFGWGWGTDKLYLHFQIDEGIFKGANTCSSYNINGGVRTTSKYYRDFCKLRGRVPSRSDAKMDPRLFHGHRFNIRVETRFTRDMDGNKIEDDDHQYSWIVEVGDEAK